MFGRESAEVPHEDIRYHGRTKYPHRCAFRGKPRDGPRQGHSFANLHKETVQTGRQSAIQLYTVQTFAPTFWSKLSDLWMQVLQTESACTHERAASIKFRTGCLEPMALLV